ncbi:MAG TPA: outer membrane protein assembly factor BamD [Mariprofundaceae bacterium]|nr:outer membrane protein assembly factor BamD [Mariprofundaceae bacterium]
MKRILLMICVALAVTACASDFKRGTAEGDYKYAKHLLDKGSYSKANTFLQDYGTKHPYSKYAVQAELLRTFAAYKGQQYVLSETLADEFIRRHPRHPDVDYAQYMLAMSQYRQMLKPERDQTETYAAIKSFKKLLSSYPDSVYAKEGAHHLQILYNHLGAHELDVGKFYFDRGRYVAAANRFQVVLDKYQTTPSIEEALYYLAASYVKLGVMNNARDTVKLLRYNYPKSDWSHKAADLLQ